MRAYCKSGAATLLAGRVCYKLLTHCELCSPRSNLYQNIIDNCPQVSVRLEQD